MTRLHYYTKYNNYYTITLLHYLLLQLLHYYTFTQLYYYLIRPQATASFIGLPFYSSATYLHLLGEVWSSVNEDCLQNNMGATPYGSIVILEVLMENVPCVRQIMMQFAI